VVAEPYKTKVQLSTGHVVSSRSLSLAELLDGARSGYAPYIGELRARHGDELEAAIEYLVGDFAAELIDDLFMSLPRLLRGYEHDGRFHGWMFAAAVNRARTHARSERRRPDGAELPAGFQSGALSDIEDRLTESTLMQRALEVLPHGERDAWLLSYEGYPPREIADRLGIDVNAATVRVHRARKRLTTQLKALVTDV